MSSRLIVRNRRSMTAVSFMAALVLLSVLLPLAAGGVAPAKAASPEPGDVESVDLELIGQSDLASPGHDGETKPRGNNGDVAVLNDYAYVAGGALFHGAQSSPGRICTDYGGVKVVDISDPANPQLEAPIEIADLKSVLTGPTGNNRRGKSVANVSSSASSVDAISVDTPSFQGDLLAIATQRCEPSFFNGARIEFWDVTDPTDPEMIGDFNPEEITSPRSGAWGIFEDVRMFTQPDQPGKLFALATTPFSIGNSHDASPFGDMRLLDITDPRAPSDQMQVGTFPPVEIGQNSENGCRTFMGGRSAAPTPDGEHAIFSFYDGSYDFDPNRTAAVFKLTLDDLPEHVPGTGTTEGTSPEFSPEPAHWGYPRGALDQNWLDEGSKTEGNAADVHPFTGPGESLMTVVSEEDFDPAITMLSIDNPASIVHTSRACEALFTKKIYRLPGEELSGDVAYVGRGCPASRLDNTTLTAADEYLQDPAGKIAIVEGGGSLFDGCSNGAKVKRAQAAGATGVMFSLGSDFLNLPIPGPDGGYPQIPFVGIQVTPFNKMVGYVPNRVLVGTTFPSTWTRSSTTNVSVTPNAFAVTAATNESPIKITTSTSNPGGPTAHGLATGDHVTISGVEGNTGANGNWTVTVTSATQFTLDGSSGNGNYTGGGIVQVCPPSDTNCAATATRTDFSRFKSVANATDRVASGEVATASRFNVAEGQTYRAGAFMEVASHTDGAFRTVIEWFDADGNYLGQNVIKSLNAVTTRAHYSRSVTPPEGAVKGSAKFEWTGASAEGIGYADAITLVPAGTHVTLEDQEDEWGAQRIIDFSQDPPAEAASYSSPTSLEWPPPDQGIYAPRQARTVNDELAFTTWMSDGLRVLDVSDPTSPTEVGSYVTPDVEDPSSEAGAGPTNEGESGNMTRGDSWPDKALANGVEVFSTGEDEGIVVMSDINAGLYIFEYHVNRVPEPDPVCPGFEDDPRNQVVGTAAGEVLEGTSGPDIICAKGGADTIIAKGGADLVIGAGGKDDITGGGGDDELVGGGQGDVVRGKGGADTIKGSAGPDDLFGNVGDDTLRGNTGNDDLNGGRDTDNCRGGSGTDSLTNCES